MCGICGIYHLEISQAVQKDEIDAMCRTLVHRGPDDQGIFVRKTVGMGMRRLSIIDKAGGRQPIWNEDKSIWVVFNGEIYNYKELRASLLKKGHQFSTKSDTECIVHLYEDFGNDFVNHLRGMFAIGLYDVHANRLILARDRFGIKPLFYAEHDNKLFFASEMKAILQRKNFPRDIDDEGLAAYFNLSYIPAPLTIFKKIRKLLPGHLLICQNGHTQIKKYWDLEFETDRSKSENHFTKEFMRILRESVEMRLMSEVPLGAFLSGGIDSSTVVALMSNVSLSTVNTVTIGFGGETGGYLDERAYARQVANMYKTNHEEREVLPDVGNIIKSIVRAFDEPFADDSTIPSYLLCKTAKENVTVALSGLGGDEVFAGYERYLGFGLSRIYEKIPRYIRERVVRKFVEGLKERVDGHYTINHMKRFVRSASLPVDQRYLGYSSISNSRTDIFAEPDRFDQPMQACKDMMLAYFNAPNAIEALNKVFYFDIKTYLPEDILAVTDRMSMHHSLEVRVPFLDHKLVEFCATIPPEMKMKWFRKKYLLKKAVKHLLPREVISHRKQGFVGPMARWLQTDLKQYVLETLSKNELKKHGLFNSGTIHRLLEEHFAGKEIHDSLIWALIIFQIWYNLYIEHPLKG